MSEQHFNWHLLANMVGAGLAVIALAFIGMRAVFLTASIELLSSALAGAILLLPIFVVFAYHQGKIEARGALNVIERVTSGLAPMTVANVRAQSIYERDMERRLNQRMAQEFMSGMNEAIPQLTSGNGTRPQVIDQGGEVTL